jgi:hypothetical protein
MRRIALVFALVTLLGSSGCGTLIGFAVDAATDGDGSAIAAGAAVDVACAGAVIESATEKHRETHSTTVIVEHRCR